MQIDDVFKLCTECLTIRPLHVYLCSSCVSYVPEPDDTKLLKCSLAIYKKFDRYPEAMKIAIQLNNIELIKDVFLSCTGRYCSLCTTIFIYNVSSAYIYTRQLYQLFMPALISTPSVVA